MNFLVIRFFFCMILLLACPVLCCATFCLAPMPVMLRSHLLSGKVKLDGGVAIGVSGEPLESCRST